MEIDLARFVDAQQPVYARVVSELAGGHKQSHWIWFVFPQLRGLGRSETARHFGIASREEALAYWQHPVLGARLKECTAIMLAVQAKSAHDILGSPDDSKFCSSMTLFEQVASEEPLFARALERFYGGKRDEATLSVLDAN